MAVSKNNSKLLTEINTMEDYLSRILKQIKITDPFPLEAMHYDNNEDHSLISLATYYHQCLNVILNNLTSGFNSPDEIQPHLIHDRFFNMQLVIQK